MIREGLDKETILISYSPEIRLFFIENRKNMCYDYNKVALTGGICMISNDAHRILLDKTIAELALQEIINTNIFFLSSLEQKDPGFEIRNSKHRRILYMAMHRKLATIITKLAISQESADPIDTSKYIKTERVFNTPKVYDDLLWKCQWEVYSKMTELLCAPSSDHSLLEPLESPALVSLFSSTDSSTNRTNTVSPHPHKTGVSFIEYILLLNIYLTTHGRSLGVLNRPLLPNNEKDRKRAQKFIQTMETTIQSQALIRSYVNTFFQFYFTKVADYYDNTSDAFIDERLFAYQNAFYTSEDIITHFESLIRKINADTILSVAPLDIISRLAETLVHSAFTNSNEITPAFLTTTSLTPETEYTMDKLFSKTFTIRKRNVLVYSYRSANINPALRNQYLPAIQHAQIIYTFITESISAAKKLLTCLSEFSAQEQDPKN